MANDDRGLQELRDDFHSMFGNSEPVVAVNWMSDDELSRAICKKAIDQGIDPNKHGVIPAAEMLSPELLARRKMTARLISDLSQAAGLSEEHAKDSLQALGLLPADEAPEAVSADVVPGIEIDSPRTARALAQIKARRYQDNQAALATQAMLDAFVQAEAAAEAEAEAANGRDMDKWLRPLAVLMFAICCAHAMANAFVLAVSFGLGYLFLCSNPKAMLTRAARRLSSGDSGPKALSAQETMRWSSARECGRCKCRKPAGESFRIDRYKGSNISISVCEMCQEHMLPRKERSAPWHTPDHAKCGRCNRAANEGETFRWCSHDGRSQPICKYCEPYLNRRR
jgi:hypothetical protein